jgi:hypothetical protein
METLFSAPHVVAVAGQAAAGSPLIDPPAIINNALGGLLCTAILALLAYLWACLRARRAAPRRRGRR